MAPQEFSPKRGWPRSLLAPSTIVLASVQGKTTGCGFSRLLLRQQRACQRVRKTSEVLRKLGLKQITSPFATAPAVYLPVVQAVLAMDPEFDYLRTHAKPSPP
jgi:hypothetical protein